MSDHHGDHHEHHTKVRVRRSACGQRWAVLTPGNHSGLAPCNCRTTRWSTQPRALAYALGWLSSWQRWNA